MKKCMLLLLVLFLSFSFSPSYTPLTNAATDDFVIRDGVLVEYNGSGGTVIVPEGVNELGDEVFYKNYSIVNVKLPSTLVTIGQNAFWNVYSIKSITMPPSVKTIRGGAFEFCFNLSSVTFLGTVETIGLNAFKETPWEKTTFSKYDTVGGYQNGGFLVQKNDKYGLAGLSGEEILSCIYNGLLPVDGGGFEIELDGVWLLVDNELQPIEDTKLDYSMLPSPIRIQRTLILDDYSADNTVPTELFRLGYSGRTNIFLDHNQHINIAYESGGSITILIFDWNLSLLRKFSVPMEMPLFGTVAVDEYGNYYMFFGKSIDGFQQHEQNLVIVKYDSNGAKLASVRFVGYEGSAAGTRIPFRAANASISISNNLLAAHFGREMFNGHQSTTVLYIDTVTMEPLIYDIPYVSHSFEQKSITTRDGGFLFVDHGDAYERGFMIHKVTKSGASWFTPFHFRELSHYNNTGAALGGIAESNYGYLLAGCSDRILSNKVIPNEEAEPRDLFIQIIKKNFGTRNNNEDKIISHGVTRKAEGISNNIGLQESGHSYFLPANAIDYGIVWLTSYTKGENVMSPKVVATDNGFALLWERTKDGQNKWGRDIQEYIDTWYMLLNPDGSVAKPATKVAGNPRLPEQDKMVYANGRIYWLSVENKICKVNALALFDVPGATFPNPLTGTAPNIETASGWAKESIISAIAKGFVPEDLQGNYTKTITRQEFCRLAVKYIEYASGKSIDALLTEKGLVRDEDAFTDTANADILAAYALGITSGSGEGTFTPNGQFTRESAAQMIMNVRKALGYDVSNPPPSGFADADKISSWTKAGVDYCVSAGIMSGGSGNTFNPKGLFTREMSIMTFDNIEA